MKKILFIIGFFIILSYSAISQISTQKMSGGEQTLKTSQTLTWMADVEAKDVRQVEIAFYVETVNTSNLKATFYMDKSGCNGLAWENIANETLTFTQSAGVNSTQETLTYDSFYAGKLRARVIAQSSAQTFNITPYIKTTRK